MCLLRLAAARSGTTAIETALVVSVVAIAVIGGLSAVGAPMAQAVGAIQEALGADGEAGGTITVATDADSAAALR